MVLRVGLIKISIVMIHTASADLNRFFKSLGLKWLKNCENLRGALAVSSKYWSIGSGLLCCCEPWLRCFSSSGGSLAGCDSDAIFVITPIPRHFQQLDQGNVTSVFEPQPEFDLGQSQEKEGDPLVIGIEVRASLDYYTVVGRLTNC